MPGLHCTPALPFDVCAALIVRDRTKQNYAERRHFVVPFPRAPTLMPNKSSRRAAPTFSPLLSLLVASDRDAMQPVAGS